MAQSPPPAAYVPRQQYRYPEPQPATIQVTARPQNVQPRTNVQARPPQPRPAASRQLTTSRARAPQRVVSQPKPQQQTQARRGVGLQDRITLAIRKRVEQSKQRSNAAMNRAQTIPVSGEPSQARQVQYQQTAPTLAEALPVLGPPKVAVTTNQRNPGKARNLGYRPEPGTENDQVIVPSFVDSDFEVSAPLELASIEHPVAPERRGPPRVTSRAQPMGYVSAHKGDQPVFRNAKAQLGSSQEEDSERLRRLENELDARSSQSRDSELPQRPGQESSPLLDVDDDDADTAEEEARRARSKLDAELDAFDDDDSDIDLEDEGDDESPPVYDERGCAELRDMLLNQPIREISLDISPPASPRRFEIGNITRSWTDHAGNVIATGTMVDLRRGYVILDSGQKLPYAKLGEADWTAIAENWLLPSVCSIGQRGNLGRNWAPQTVTWHASSLCHKPLYFENVQLERYGHSHGPIMQPVRSAIHFFGSIIFLPYNTAINPPNECRSALGYYRPGSCAPWLLDPIPFSREGIRRQALATVGAAFIP